MKKRASDDQLSLWQLLESASSAGGASPELEKAPVAPVSPNIPAARRAFAEKAPLVLMDASDSRGMSPAILAQVVPSRLALLAERPDAEEATDLEAMLYLSSASFTAPLPDSFANIFFHLCVKLLPQGREVLGDVPRALGISESYDLTALKGWIYRQQVKQLKGGGRGGRGAGKKRPMDRPHTASVSAG